MPPKDDFDSIDDGPLSAKERARLRRMLLDDAYARRFRTAVKVWIITIGTVASALVAVKVLWSELIEKVLK